VLRCAAGWGARVAGDLGRCRTPWRGGRTDSGWRTLVRPACAVDTRVDSARNYPPEAFVKGKCGAAWEPGRHVCAG